MSTRGDSSMIDPRTVTEFWFGALEEQLADAAHRKRWFLGGAAFDETVRTRFGHLVEQAASGALDAWLDDADPVGADTDGAATGCLAFVLVCDQFSRQIHRGDARAFATDALALEVARTTIERRLDARLGWDERAFLYLPFEHSENLVDQHTAVGLYVHLREQAPEAARAVMDDYLRYALQHRDIVARFGRFPHRNAALERTSTPEEIEYLATAPHFGQARPS